MITKFNNKNIIYIPNNSFEDYLNKFGILNAFNIENIELGESKQNEANNTLNIINISILPLELESDIRKKYKVLNGTDDNKEIFIKNNIKDSFIKLYIQFDTFEGKLV